MKTLLFSCLSLAKLVKPNRIWCPFIFTVSLFLLACSDFLRVDAPENQIVKKVVFSDDRYATSAATGIYSQLSSTSGFASGTQQSITMLAGLSADDFTIYTTAPGFTQFYDNSLTPTNTSVRDTWNSCYEIIYMSNSLIEGLNSSTGLTKTAKIQLLGEAKFLRAFSLFYLTALYGDVPIVTTTDVNVNRSPSRAPQIKVYEQIEKDLVDARESLPETYEIYNQERVRATKYAASALLARLYLHKEDWLRAEAESTRIIKKTDQYALLGEPNKVFLKNSKEAIWQLMPIRTIDTSEAIAFAALQKPSLITLSESLVTAFDNDDKRKLEWIKIIQVPSNGSTPAQTYYYPSKYHEGQTKTEEYSMVLRVAEQYLIRAEARLKQNKFTGNESAESDLNKIRGRSGLPNTTAITDEELIMDVMNQRRFEFFAEWGHRWLDLKRTNLATQVLQPLKPFWKNSSVLYPIPQYELVNNHNLKQNEGYSN